MKRPAFAVMRLLGIVFAGYPSSLSKFYAEALHCKLQGPSSGLESWKGYLEAQGIPEEDLPHWGLQALRSIVD